MRTIVRTNYLVDVNLLGRYSQRTNYADLIDRHIYIDADEDLGTAAEARPSKAKSGKNTKNKRGAVKKAPKAAKKLVAASKPAKKVMLALLIAAHDEEMVIEQTIQSAIKAGQPAQHIYVVDDNSTDKTSDIAIGILGEKNVVRVGRSGKGLALTKAAHHFDLTDRYKWIHIADADGAFVSNYFKIMRESLDPKFAAAAGYVRSLPGSTVGQYRVYEYTLGQEIHRRFQALTNTVTVIPGPTSVFRSDVFAKVNFANKSLTEDFDVTIQIHRQRLGKIQFIPKAVAYTQDPRNLRDFTKQITRWNRGMMQVIRRHGIGHRANRIDAYLGYQVMQNFLFLANIAVILPYYAIRMHSPNAIAIAFLLDVSMMLGLTILTGLKAGRKDILSAFPQIYLYRAVTLYIFLKAFTEVIILRRYKTSEGIWGTAGRRYKNAVTV